MAQLVEQLIRNQQVAGSSPATSSKKEQECIAFLFFFGVGTKRREPENPTQACELLDTLPTCGYNNTCRCLFVESF